MVDEKGRPKAFCFGFEKRWISLEEHRKNCHV